MVTMRFRQTRHQTPRGTRADKEGDEGFVLYKQVRRLHATYQLRLLLFRAVKENKVLVLLLPDACELEADLLELQRENPNNLVVQRR